MQPQGPVGPIVRLFHVVKGLYLSVHGLLSDPKYLPHTPSEGHGPLVAVVRLPVGRYDGCGRDIPPLGQVVVDEVLKEELVDIISIIVTCIGP